MRGLTHLMWVQFKLYLREPAAFFFTLAFPALCLLLFGAIYGNEPMPAFWGRPVGTVDASVPAYLGLIIGTIALMNIPIDTAANRDCGALRRFRATPLRPVTYLAASIAVYFLVALLGIAILVVIGKLVFDLKLAGSWPAVLAGFTLSSLAFFAVGYVLASVARSARMAQALGMALFFRMIFLSGAGMPVQMLPPGLQEFSKLLPLSYVVKLMQCLWFPLAGWSPAYYLVGANFFGLMWAFLPFGGAVAGNVGLMLLMLLRSLVTSGEPLASLWAGRCSSPWWCWAGPCCWPAGCAR